MNNKKQFTPSDGIKALIELGRFIKKKHSKNFKGFNRKEFYDEITKHKMNNGSK